MPRPSRWAEVVAAAGKVFREKGYSAATLEQIAAEVGMLKGSLYNYITSKEELLFAVVRPPAEQLLAQARRLAGESDPAPQRLQRLAEIHVQVLGDFFDYAAVYISDVAGLDRFPEWAAMDREYVELTRSILVDGVREGSLSPHLDVTTAPHVFIGALNWMTRWWDPAGPVPAQEMARRISDLFLDGARRVGDVDAPVAKP